ncbi:polar amino acid transport system ATP-binding protein [Butyrivibrio fibrisolvens DSM 3071]|uniref:Polar amino acid transport system ATP-binding protein n=1 Tax=Butyrivibrio fibrisolvens DSM 3071 TaxID=1121131 RepID=A0A1M5WLA1_BUTFI|nr:amino acid ABC transporter ATP-binding protein [Butyrivibrio fibrisolvens]SHH88257.1 polar amino acid transport system ATP-binding protein [Butyrivibrio fibrisolvens DSM 3071]
MDMIRLEGVSKSYGKSEVLKDVNLSVEKGEIVVLIGGSGCGKSTLLRMIEMLEIPDEGKIYIGDEEITRAKGAQLDKLRMKLGMVYQGFHLFSHMDVMKNITLAPMKLKGMSKEDAEKKAMELLKTVGLSDKAHAMPDQLSGGQKQRIAICRCLAMDPEVMLFDEPTSALDPTMIGEVLATIRLLAKQNMTMVIVTHEMNFAREVGSHIIFLAEHMLYEEGTPEDIFDNPQKQLTKDFIFKLKHFTYDITSKDFDLMKLHGGIQKFGEKYGIDGKYIIRLQLYAEELIQEVIEQNVWEFPDISLRISLAEGTRDVNIDLLYFGKNKDIFEILETDIGGIHIGLTILKKVAKHREHSYKYGINTLKVVI